MPKRISRYLLIHSMILVSAVSTLIFSTAVVAEKPFSVVFNDNWPPFSYRDENNEMSGILVDIVKEVFETKLNRPVVFYGYPWKRAQHNVKVGVHDALVTTATAERLAYGIKSNESVYTLEEKAFISTTSKHKEILSRLTLKNIAKLQSFKVCDMIGNGWAENFYGPRKIDVEFFGDINLCFRSVAFKRYDIVIHVSAAGLTLLKSEGLHDKVEMLPTVFDEVPFTLIVSKKSQHLDILPTFNKAIKVFKEDGGIQRIVDRYTR